MVRIFGKYALLAAIVSAFGAAAVAEECTLVRAEEITDPKVAAAIPGKALAETVIAGSPQPTDAHLPICIWAKEVRYTYICCNKMYYVIEGRSVATEQLTSENFAHLTQSAKIPFAFQHILSDVAQVFKVELNLATWWATEGEQKSAILNCAGTTPPDDKAFRFVKPKPPTCSASQVYHEGKKISYEDVLFELPERE